MYQLHLLEYLSLPAIGLSRTPKNGLTALSAYLDRNKTTPSNQPTGSGIRLRLRFRTVKNHFVCAVARDKAHYRSMHPDVISHIDAVDEGSKRNLEKRKIDPVEVQRKRQRIEGRIEAMKYYNEYDGTKLTWMAILFDSANVGQGSAEAGGAEIFNESKFGSFYVKST